MGWFGGGSGKEKSGEDRVEGGKRMYGVSKVCGELLSEYYLSGFGVDRGCVGLGGLIWYVSGGGGGSREYGVDIYYCGGKGEKFVWGIGEGSYMDMMYMGDGLGGGVEIMEGDGCKLVDGN